MNAPQPVRGPWWATLATREADPGPVTCAVCGAPLDADTDEMPDPTGGPLCGACARARAFDQTLWELDLQEPGSGLW